MKKRRLHALPILLAALFASGAALAQAQAIPVTSSPFSSAYNSNDVAQAWIDYLFRGTIAPAQIISPYAAPLASAAAGLRQGLGLYSMGMLIFAALLVFYHIAVMVVETAHYGVPFGRRSSQIWMPIRFVLALGLLIPVSSSLSAGQYLVVKVAEEGSTLASNAWRLVASTARGHLSGLVTPRRPSVGHLAVTAVEMETCRMIYEQLYTPFETDPTIHLAGNIGSVVKIPADRFSSEAWRYSNSLNADLPLCGEYRFSGYRQTLPSAVPADAVARMAEGFSGIAHEQTDQLLSEAHMLAERVAPAFLGTTPDTSLDIREDLASLEKDYQNRLDSKELSMNLHGSAIAEQALADSANAGWLTAASFIPEIVHLQESYGELMTHTIPDAQSPILAHPALARQTLRDSFDILPASRGIERLDLQKLLDFYMRVAGTTTTVHRWLYGAQMPDKDFVAPVSADLSDRLNAATDPAATFSFFARAVDASAMTNGVWGEEPGTADAGYPFATVPYDTPYNPFAALVEFGRRQTELATSLAGLAGTGIGIPGATGPSALLGLASAGFFAGGFLLVFVVPLLPFLRFLLGVLTWGLALFEGIVAMPLVALAHLTPGGEGLSGGMGRQAYLLWFSLMVRPLLTLFGLVLGILLFSLGLAFLDAVLTPFARLALPTNTGLFVVANTGLIFLYDVLVFGAANASFKGIDWLPQRALNWVTSFTVTDTGEVPTPAAPGVGPAGASAILPYLGASLTGVMGRDAVTTSTITGHSGNNPMSAAAQSHSMKMALFPAYGERGSGSAGSGTGGSPGVVSSNTSVAGTMGNPSSPNVNVNVTNTSIGGGRTMAGGGRAAGSAPDKNTFRQSKHESSMGGKDRTGADEGAKPPAITPGNGTPGGGKSES